MSFFDSALGGLTSSAATALFNRNEADKNRAYQTQMSNTSHQREVQDLVKAGLNPVLSANGGASSPGGATASASFGNPVLEGYEGESKSSSAKSALAEAKARTKSLSLLDAQTVGVNLENDNKHLENLVLATSAKQAKMDAEAMDSPVGRLMPYIRMIQPAVSALRDTAVGLGGFGVAGKSARDIFKKPESSVAKPTLWTPSSTALEKIGYKK